MPVAHLVVALFLLFSTVGLALGVVIIRQPDWLIGMLAHRSPEVLYFVETTEPIVALTIDDGPDPATTPEILDLLAASEARATFFLIGERMSRNEAVVSRIVEEGHELGNHLTRDEPSIRLSPDEFERALTEAHDVLSQFAPVRWVRPGSGWYNDSMLAIIRENGYRCALGSIYPYDGQINWPEFSVRHILRKVRPGSIIVLHDGGARGERTASVLRKVLPELKKRGFRVITLTEMTNSATRGAGRAFG